MSEKTEFKQGYEALFTLKEGGWHLVVRPPKSDGGGMIGRIMQFKSFDEAASNLKENFDIK